jgi:hypothetical protein
MHLKIFVRYANSFYWWSSRFKDELQVHSNKESLGSFRMDYQKGHTLVLAPCQKPRLDVKRSVGHVKKFQGLTAACSSRILVL